jgi:hypothetical protein
MLNQHQTNTNAPVDTFAEALATARKMQQDWLEYGLNFVHFYVDDVDGDWLETWGDDEILVNPLLDVIKEFLVSDEDAAVKIRYDLGERSLFDLAVNLEESLRITKADDRIFNIQNLLVSNGISNDIESYNLAKYLVEKLL